MSKAIAGGAMLAGALGIGAGIFFTGGLLLASAPILAPLLAGLALGGISMEAGALADALSQNRGTNITTRQSAAYRQIIYGQQRIGGNIIYESTTGSKHDQYNYVIVIAGHICDSIVNLYLDGRQVFWDPGSNGNVTRNGVNFGGNSDGSTYSGPTGAHYNFGGPLVYCEARFGDQLDGDVISGLTANDPTWAAGASGSPWVAGYTYVYLKVEYDATQFPQAPEIRFTVNGKNDIYDPRTGTTGFTQNWALIMADVLCNQEYGAQCNMQADINQAQLIAAANVCDEQVPLAAGGSEYRYTANGHFDTSSAPGDILQAMMPAAGGRLSYIGGEWFIWPAYWQGPSFSFDRSSIIGDIQWNLKTLRDRYNGVKGTYVAPVYPYAIAGNLYDRNGFYYGEQQDNFNYAWQPTDYPPYSQDALHGYATNGPLTQDNGVQAWLNLDQSYCISCATAQRLAKIALMKTRQFGSATFSMNLAAYLQMQPLDVMQFTFPELGFADKLLEVTAVRFKIKTAEEEDGQGTIIYCEVDVQECDPSVYEWSTSEEISIATGMPYPALNLYTGIAQAPSALTAIFGATTSVTNVDGVVTPRILATWTAPPDGMVTQVQIQYQIAGATTWTEAGSVSAANTSAYINGFVSGQQYNVQIRSINARGGVSAWVTTSVNAAAVYSSGTGPSAPASGAPTIPTNAIATVLDDLTSWAAEHDPATPGTATGDTGVVVAGGRHNVFTYTASGGYRYHVDIGTDTKSTNFVYDVFVTAVDWTKISRLELDINHVIANGNTVLMCVQAAPPVNGGSGTWECTFSNRATSWNKSNVPVNSTKWVGQQRIRIFSKHDSSGVVTYIGVEVNGVYTAFDSTCVGPSSLALGWAPNVVVINYQQEGNGASGTVDTTASITIYRW